MSQPVERDHCLDFGLSSSISSRSSLLSAAAARSNAAAGSNAKCFSRKTRALDFQIRRQCAHRFVAHHCALGALSEHRHRRMTTSSPPMPAAMRAPGPDCRQVIGQDATCCPNAASFASSHRMIA
jgi:hypothetical protein